MTDLQPSLFAPLREAYEASRRVRAGEEPVAVLERLAAIVAETLGWGAVVFNVHRRAWDDFEVVVAHGSEASRDALLGTTHDWTQWAPLFRDRFERRGAHFVPAEAEVDPDLVCHVPPPGPATGPDAWHHDDMLLVLMRGTDGEVVGILSVDEPRSGRRPSDADIDALVAVANAAGGALQQAHEAAADAEHQRSLQHLLTVSTQIADVCSDIDVLDAVCAGIRDALGFERVVVELGDVEGRIVPVASVGWDEQLPDIPMRLEELSAIFLPEYEEQGCYVLDRPDALRLLGLPDSPYRSERNGSGPWAWHRHWLVVPLRNAAGRLSGVIWVDEPTDRLLPDTSRLQALRLFADQAQASLEAARLYEQTLYRAQHDGLTGLPNRAVLLDRLGLALRRNQRTERTIAVLFVDLDRFKTVNDTYGHDLGDAVLRTVADRITACLRPGDTVARLGGDEFVVLCEDVRGEDDALEVAGRIRAALAVPIPVEHVTVAMTASVGVALPADPTDDPQSLLRYADVAMYRAKAAGRDGQEVASEAVRLGASARAQLELALAGALERGEIALHWQPIVAASTGRILRAEALMRWSHPELGPISPLEFIPLAEENGSIVQLGRWALEEACAQWAAWQAELGEGAPAIAVNLSPRQLRDGLLSEQVAALLARHRMPPGALTVEITETALLDAGRDTIRSLTALRRLGCCIELDDFGTGQSSLSSLADFSVDGLKIDRRFVAHRDHDPRAEAIASAVLAMAAALGLRVTAEGVETEEQLAWLRARGCPEAQGYLFSRPVPASGLTGLLTAPAQAPAEAPAAASKP